LREQEQAGGALCNTGPAPLLKQRGREGLRRKGPRPQAAVQF